MSRLPGWATDLKGSPTFFVAAKSSSPITVVRRGDAALRFFDDIEGDDDHELVARLSGNDKHGSERPGKNHQRHRRSH